MRNENRLKALENGDKSFIGNNPCKVCGSYEKNTKAWGCRPCRVRKGLEKLNNAKLMAPYRTKEKQLKKLQKWRAENYEKWKAQWQRDYEKNKGSRQALYRGRKRNQTPKNADLKLIEDIYKNRPEGYEVDHIIPLSKGGLHHQDNLQYLTISENRKKGNRL